MVDCYKTMSRRLLNKTVKTSKTQKSASAQFLLFQTTLRVVVFVIANEKDELLKEVVWV